MSKPDRPTRAQTLAVRDRCLCMHAQRAARVLARRFDEAFRPLDLTNKQFSLLMALNRPQPPTMAMVATDLAMDRTTLTAALKPLERRGLVEVRRKPGDRRALELLLTDQGGQLLGRALPIWEATHAAVEAALAQVSPDALRAALRELDPCDAAGGGIGQRSAGSKAPS